jgi:hypothetical protein
MPPSTTARVPHAALGRDGALYHWGFQPDEWMPIPQRRGGGRYVALSGNGLDVWAVHENGRIDGWQVGTGMLDTVASPPSTPRI